MDPDSIKQTIADAVSSKLIGYASKEGTHTVLKYFGDPLTEGEVEISEEVVLLKAEDAQKLLEPPKLDRLHIQPERIDLRPHEHVSFTVKGTDQYGHPLPVENPSWSAPGCDVGQDGQIRVGETEGLYVVTVRCGECETQAQIRVSAAKLDKKKGGDGDEGDDQGQKYICWAGSIPPQKWTTFYMKVVSPFASASGLKLTVKMEVPADLSEEQSKAQIERIRTAVRDLGLEHDPELS
jgi:hypothetical protein